MFISELLADEDELDKGEYLCYKMDLVLTNRSYSVQERRNGDHKDHGLFYANG